MRDEGTTEIIGFMLILSVLLTIIAIASAVYLPVVLEAAEEESNEKAFAAFVSLSNDITALCLTGDIGESRQSALPKTVLFQNGRVSLTYQTKKTNDAVISDHAVYREMVLSYNLQNTASDDVTISLSNQGIQKNSEPIIPPALFFVVDEADTPTQIEYDSGIIRIAYTYRGTITSAGQTYHVVSVRLT